MSQRTHATPPEATHQASLGRTWGARLAKICAPLGIGGLGALGFPCRIPGLGDGPVLEWAPRELFLLAFGAWIFAQLKAQSSLREQFGRVAWASFGFYAVLISWLDIAMERFGGMSGLEAWPAVMLLFALCAGLQACVVFLFAALRGRSPWPDVVSFGIAWTVAEWMRGSATQFPWGQWAYAAARLLPLCQWAAWGGFYIVSFWTAVFAAGAYEVVWSSKTTWRRHLSIYVLCVAGVLGVGAARFWTPPMASEAPWPALQVGVVQASIPQTVKNDARGHRDMILQTYRRLSLEAQAQGAELLIWPESAWPGYLPADTARLAAAPLGLPLLLGVSLFEDDAPLGASGPAPAFKIFNSALWVDGDMRVLGRYDKQKLVPFGEYVPLRGILPVQRLVPGSLDCTPGAGGAPLGDSGMGVLICYDGVYPGPARAHVRAGAKFLVNITNDAWYGLSSAPYQHRDYYVLRAIESGRDVIRAANSGISLHIDAMGRMGPGTPINARTPQISRVSLAPPEAQTLYVRFGDVWLGTCVVAVLVALLRIALRL